MPRKRKTQRPSDPMEIARRRAVALTEKRDPATWGLNAVALDLPTNAGVDRRGDLAGRVARARRVDVFDLFLGRGALSQAGHDAVRRLQEDLAVLHRTLAGGGDVAPRIDRSRDPETFSQRRRRAGERIAAALALAGAASARLIAALCEAEVVLGQPADWRAVVARETGERLADAQGALLRMACENLAGAYVIVDRRHASAG